VEVKLVELRDRATFIPMIAVKLTHRGAAEAYLLRAAGFGDTQIDPLKDPSVQPYVVLVNLVKDEAHWDAFQWSNRRSFTPVHFWLINNWDSFTSGDVLDVEYILKEVAEPKQSQRLTSPY
jgi:hypothetical protein